MVETFIDGIISEIIVVAILGAAAWLSRIYHCIRRQGKRGWRQSQAIVLIAKSEDDIMDKYHPDAAGSGKLHDKVDDILKDENGNY